MAEEVKILPDSQNRARKRRRQPLEWKREKAKIARYSPKQLPEFPQCGHRGQNLPYFCWSLSMNDVKKFHDRFYCSKKKTDQDLFILSYCSGVMPARKRPRERLSKKPKNVSIVYTVQKQDGSTIRVCRDAFLKILNVKKDRVLRLVKKFKNTGVAVKEARGGDRVKDRNNNKKKQLKIFIESLKCTESHYCRSDCPHRVYLPCELNVKKLWQIYNNTQTDDSLKVKQCFFRNYFNANYNVGFGTPQTDLCSTCIQYKEKIKRSTDAITKQSLITNYRVHKLQAKSFYTLLQQDYPEMITFSFDCQKNLPLPKLPDQQAYFSMQVNFYNFGVVIGSSRTKLSSENNVRCYVWTEVQRPKSSNEIASAIHHTLQNYEFQPGNKIVRLFCDGCSGQNKNSIVIGMLCHWLSCSAPPNIKELHVIFPIVGHSFIPPDRVFGNIEKVVRRTAEILDPDSYINIIQERAKIFQMGKDYKVFDWKEETQKILKPTTQWHFKFKPTKRFILTKNSTGMVMVRGEAVFRTDLGEAKGIYKKGKKIEAIKLRELPVGIGIKIDKIKSIGNLLKVHYGDDWKSDNALVYFKKILEEQFEHSGQNIEEKEYEEDVELQI